MDSYRDIVVRVKKSMSSAPHSGDETIAAIRKAWRESESAALKSDGPAPDASIAPVPIRKKAQ